jgi:hypothetical protein
MYDEMSPSQEGEHGYTDRISLVNKGSSYTSLTGIYRERVYCIYICERRNRRRSSRMVLDLEHDIRAGIRRKWRPADGKRPSAAMCVDDLPGEEKHLTFTPGARTLH